MPRLRKCKVCPGWHDLDKPWPAACIRERTTSRSAFPMPYMVRPFSDPVQSMADGKFYDDPASLRATYKASGNPQGVDYIEVGNEDTTKFTPPTVDKKAQRDAIERAIADVENGNAKPILDRLPV